MILFHVRTVHFREDFPENSRICERFFCGIPRSISGNQNDRNFRSFFLKGFKNRHPILARHSQVTNNEVDFIFSESINAVTARSCFNNIVVEMFEHSFKSRPGISFIINNQNIFFHIILGVEVTSYHGHF